MARPRRNRAVVRGPVRNVTDLPAGKRDPQEAKLVYWRTHRHAAPTDRFSQSWFSSLRRRSAHAQDDRGKSKEQVEFGIKVAQNGLWNEALYRWEKATELDPTYAAAWNNLAIAYEHEGKFEEAKKAYEKALAAGSEEPDDPAELRSLQRNQ